MAQEQISAKKQKAMEKESCWSENTVGFRATKKHEKSETGKR